MKSTTIEKKLNSSSNSTKPFFGRSIVQTKLIDEKVYYPIIGVSPIMNDTGKAIRGVRVIYIGINETGLQINFTGIESFETAIRNDEKFNYFINNVSITNLNNKLYYEWMNEPGGNIQRMAISNPESKRQDGISGKESNKTEQSIKIELTAPISVE